MTLSALHATSKHQTTEWDSESRAAAVEREASLAFLAAVVLGGVPQAKELLAPTDFYAPAHQRIYTSALALQDAGEPVGLITVQADLVRRGDAEVVGREVFADIAAMSGEPANVEQYASIVKNAANTRRIVGFAREVEQRCQDPTHDAAGIMAFVSAESERLSRFTATKAKGRFSAAALDAVAFSALQIEKPRSLLGDRLLTAGGFGILYGKPGLGKSWLALQLARSLIRGEPWLGLSTQSEGVRVGVLQLELDASQMQERLSSLGLASRARDVNAKIITRPLLKGLVDLLNDQDMAELREWVTRERLDVVIIDALSRAHRADENSAKEFGPVLSALDSLRHDTGCAVLTVHHEPKPRADKNEDDDLSALRGTSRLQSDPTLLMRVRQSRGVRCIRFAKVTSGPTPEPIYFVQDEKGNPVLSEGPEAILDRNAQKVLLAVTSAGRPVSRAEVQGVSRLAESTTRKHLAKLVQEGKLISSGEGKDVRYAPPPATSAIPATDPTMAATKPFGGNEIRRTEVDTRSATPKPFRYAATSAPLKGEQRSVAARCEQEGPRGHRPDPDPFDLPDGKGHLLAAAGWEHSEAFASATAEMLK